MEDKIEDEPALNILLEDAVNYARIFVADTEDNLTKDQWDIIEESRIQIKNGNYKTYEEVKQYFAD